MVSASRLDEDFEDVAYVLMSVFDVDEGDLEYPVPEVVDSEEFERRDVASVDEGSIFYSPKENAVVVDEGVERFSSEHSIPIAGEEAGHWLRESLGAGIEDYVDLPDLDRLGSSSQGGVPDEFLDDLRDVDTKVYMKADTVDEFVGRLGALAAESAIGGQQISPEVEPWDLPDSYIKNSRPSEVRRGMWNEDYLTFQKMDLYHFWNDVAHMAGRRAADDQFQEALGDEGVLSRDPEQLWLDYSMDDYEKEAIREIR